MKMIPLLALVLLTGCKDYNYVYLQSERPPVIMSKSQKLDAGALSDTADYVVGVYPPGKEPAATNHVHSIYTFRMPKDFAEVGDELIFTNKTMIARKP